MNRYDVTSLEELRAIPEKLRMLVEASRLDFADTSLSVTISVGATLLLPNDTPETIFHRADRLMYHSKQTGHKQIRVG
jgi:PleD family two-component response regulator